ncbi:MAG: TonB-dependent receptor [Betaproteobacteria bacterium]|nr:TonB-dependent receptor [Betaproteobacteria bacterium]
MSAVGIHHPLKLHALAAALMAVTSAWSLQARAHQDVEAPTVHVIGHYETGVGTSDAASEGGVTAKRIETRPLLRTGEIIELVPGMIVTQHSGDGKANQYFLRGYNLDHGTDFAIWVDGMPVNKPTHGHGQGYADINFMIPELVSKVGFRKGPYFAEEGYFSSAGVARIRYYDKMPQAIGTLTYGSNNNMRGVVANSTNVGPGTLLYAFEGVNNDGPWELPQGLKKYNGVLRFSQGTEAHGFNVSLMGYDSKWTSTDQIPRRAVDQGLIGLYGNVDPTDGGKTSRYSLSFSGRAPMAGGQARIDAYMINYSLDLWSNFSYFLGNPVNGDQFQQSDRRNVFGANPSYSFSTPLWGHEGVTTVGLQSRHDAIGRVGLYGSEARVPNSTTRQDKVAQTSVAAYIQNSTQWLPWLRTLIGARADHYRFDVTSSIPENSGKRTDNLVSPKVSFILGPWEHTEYFVNFGTGFHSNDARGTVIRYDPTDYQNGTLTPVQRVNPLVRTRGAEIGARTEIIPGVQSSLALWMLKQDSELLFIGDAGTTEASRPSKRQGMEWITYARPLDWLLIDAELSVTKSKFNDGDPTGVGSHIPGALSRVATLGVTVEDRGPWYGAVQMRHFGPRPLVEDNSLRSRSTTVTNMRVGYRIDKQFRLHLDVLNLLNSKRDDITYAYESCLRQEVGVHPDCPALGGGAGVFDQHFHPVERRQFRLTLFGQF